jgi:hypothetical protein
VSSPARSSLTHPSPSWRNHGDLLAIVLACSLHPDDALVTTLVDVQSEGNVYFVGDLKTLKSRDWLRSAEAALQYSDELRAQCGRPAVGLLGIPLDWASR